MLYYFPSPIGWSRTRPRCLYISPCLECLSFICLDNLFILQNPVYVTPSVMLSLIPSDTVNHCSLSVISVLPITLHNVGSVIYRTFSFLPSLRARIMSYFIFVYSTDTTILEPSRTSKKFRQTKHNIPTSDGYLISPPFLFYQNNDAFVPGEWAVRRSRFRY